MNAKLREHMWSTFIYVRNQFIGSNHTADGRGAIFAYFNDDYVIEEIAYLTPIEIMHLKCVDDEPIPEREKILQTVQQYDVEREYVIVMYLRAGIYTDGNYGQFISVVSKIGYGRAS